MHSRHFVQFIKKQGEKHANGSVNPVLPTGCVSRESGREVTYSDIGYAALGPAGRSILGNHSNITPLKKDKYRRKGKVVPAVLGTEFVQFLAALTVLH